MWDSEYFSEENYQLGIEGRRRKNMGQSQDILWQTVSISQKFFTLRGRQVSQIWPRQQHQRRSRQEIKRSKRHSNYACHDAAATSRAAQPNEIAQ